MIQWRNFNIDPDWYLGKINVIETNELMGIKQMMELIREEFPDLQAERKFFENLERKA